MGLPSSSCGKESAHTVGDLGLVPGSGRFIREGNGYPLQYSCLENPMDRGAWWTAVHGSQRVEHDWVNKMLLKLISPYSFSFFWFILKIFILFPFLWCTALGCSPWCLVQSKHLGMSAILYWASSSTHSALGGASLVSTSLWHEARCVYILFYLFIFLLPGVSVDGSLILTGVGLQPYSSPFEEGEYVSS